MWMFQGWCWNVLVNLSIQISRAIRTYFLSNQSDRWNICFVHGMNSRYQGLCYQHSITKDYISINICVYNSNHHQVCLYFSDRTDSPPKLRRSTPYLSRSDMVGWSGFWPNNDRNARHDRISLLYVYFCRCCYVTNWSKETLVCRDNRQVISHCFRYFHSLTKSSVEHFSASRIPTKTIQNSSFFLRITLIYVNTEKLFLNFLRSQILH